DEQDAEDTVPMHWRSPFKPMHARHDVIGGQNVNRRALLDFPRLGAARRSSSSKWLLPARLRSVFVRSNLLIRSSHWRPPLHAPTRRMWLPGNRTLGEGGAGGSGRAATPRSWSVRRRGAFVVVARSAASPPSIASPSNPCGARHRGPPH